MCSCHCNLLSCLYQYVLALVILIRENLKDNYTPDGKRSDHSSEIIVGLRLSGCRSDSETRTRLKDDDWETAPREYLAMTVQINVCNCTGNVRGPSQFVDCSHDGHWLIHYFPSFSISSTIYDIMVWSRILNTVNVVYISYYILLERLVTFPSTLKSLRNISWFS